MRYSRERCNMEQSFPRFTIVNDPEHDFNLMMEVSTDNNSSSVADVRKASGIWLITFFCREHQLELEWESMLKIMQKFADFVQEMESGNVL